jgi:hypothetical protein
MRLSGVGHASVRTGPENIERSILPDHPNREVTEQVGVILEAYEIESAGGAFPEKSILIKRSSQAGPRRQASQCRESVRVAGIEICHDDLTERLQNPPALSQDLFAIQDE